MSNRGTVTAVSPTRRDYAPTATVDALETRRLFSAAIEATRTLVIEGTAGDDAILVDLEIGLFGERTLRITENGTVSGRFAQGDVEDILVLSGDGNDYVRIGSGGGNGAPRSVTRPDQIAGGSISTPAQVEGGAGNDKLEGGAGNDTLLGGDGDDFLTGYDGDDFVDGGTGNDTVIIHFGSDTVFGGPGDDQINSEETGKSATIDGGDGNDQITGTNRKDEIRGGAGNDIIDGGRGADRVFGGDGDDRITVNQKAAKLRGEGGADVFLESGGKARKAIKDFTPGEDQIQPLLAQVPSTPPVLTSIAATNATLRADIDEVLG